MCTYAYSHHPPTYITCMINNNNNDDDLICLLAHCFKLNQMYYSTILYLCIQNFNLKRLNNVMLIDLCI